MAINTNTTNEIPLLIKNKDSYEAMLNISDSINILHKDLLKKLDSIYDPIIENIDTNKDIAKSTKDNLEQNKKAEEKKDKDKVKDKKEKEKEEAISKSKNKNNLFENFFSKTTTFFKGTFDTIGNVFDDKSITSSFLGAGNLIVEPIKELMDDPFFKNLGGAFGKVKDFFKKGIEDKKERKLEKESIKEKSKENIFGEITGLEVMDKKPLEPVIVDNMTRDTFFKMVGEKEDNGLTDLFSGGIKKEPYKKSITDNNIRKEDPGIFWFWKKTKKKKPGEQEDEEGLFGGDIKSLGGIGGIMGKVMKFLPIAGIIVALIMMIIDGIKGFFESKKWGTSKISGFIGGFLGGTGKGLSGAFKNMGKWALLGAAAGTLVMPVVGTIVGGLIGAAIGGILGFIGGERIAKAFDRLGGMLSGLLVFLEPVFKMFDSIKDRVMGAITKIKDIFKKDDSSFGEKIGKLLGVLIKTVAGIAFDLVKGYFSFLFNIPKAFLKLLKKDKLEDTTKNKGILSVVIEIFKITLGAIKNFLGGLFGEIFGDIIVKIKSGLSSFVEKSKGVYEGIVDGIKEFIGGIFMSISGVNEKAIEIFDNIKNSVSGVIKSLFNGIVEIIKNPSKVTDLLSYIMEGISNFFKDFFGGLSKIDVRELLKMAWDWGKEKITGVKETVNIRSNEDLKKVTIRNKQASDDLEKRYMSNESPETKNINQTTANVQNTSVEAPYNINAESKSVFK